MILKTSNLQNLNKKTNWFPNPSFLVSYYFKFLINSSANSEVETSFAPSIKRAKS